MENFTEREYNSQSIKDLLKSNQTDFIELANIITHTQGYNVIDLTSEIKKQNHEKALKDFGQNVLKKFYVYLVYTKKDGTQVGRFGYMNCDYAFAGGGNNAKPYGYITYFDIDADGWRNCMPAKIEKFVVMQHIPNIDLLSEIA